MSGRLGLVHVCLDLSYTIAEARFPRCGRTTEETSYGGIEAAPPQLVRANTAGGRWGLTPMQRLRQLEPSWFRRGQTTSLLASVIEKDEVKEDRGGILKLTPPCAGGGDDGGGGGGGGIEGLKLPLVDDSVID